MPYIFNTVGQPPSNPDGNAPGARAGRLGDTIISALHGRYFETTLRGNVFICANQAAVTFQAGLATTFVGLALINPPTNSKAFSLLQVEFVPASGTDVAGVVALGINAFSSTAFTNTTSGSAYKAFINAPTASTATISFGGNAPAAATYAKFLACMPVTNSTGFYGTTYDVNGSIVLPPGTAVQIVASAALTGWGSMTWEELPFTS